MRHTRTAAFHTLGCKLNFAETSTLSRSLEEAGYARVRVEERPDVFVLNTCSVTENADKECRRHVRRFREINPEAFIAVVGCYAQLKPEEIVSIEGVDLVLGANEKFDLAAHIEARYSGLDPESRLPTAVFSPIKDVKTFIPSYNANDRTRTFLKVQDGCDYFCSFCTIPLARGRSRSATIAETLQHAKAIAASGVKEIVLTGVNTGDFGRQHGESFIQLIEALDRVEGIDRFRISSIEPNLCSDEVIDFVAGSQRFMPHLHMPLQSGSDAILERMRRRYDTALYADRVAHIKRVMPHACIGVDVITGTPGETDEEFLKTHTFLRSISACPGASSGVDYLHVFTYSERANTTAVRMVRNAPDDSIPMNIRRERTKQLRILSSKLQRAFYERHIGDTRPVLFEHGDEPAESLATEQLFGYTDNYIRVAIPYDRNLFNSIETVQLGHINADGHVDCTITQIATEAERHCNLTTANSR
ncbi:MAG: tRNA (N(6)-L-threonylcarbamoyladenosine(37)-C(2))-methylthiotransferase MtaB [Flavobacteriales bacterium]|jgi:threonylcarbamoyladenosine tRNA methylthiotransferase MtaB|nr:tRNA (N(6)-L-threonylcarbamoyladenosine(37)-C(2))-methylthiotransferase MtaB [Flavobacteriales bacterium]MBK6894400.1 tRNA (N(6)-L-threonylcarbamoyladenosine(37)-C(2))-methylthiotransferase MtaB [Flavobacteriales bacterium]MBK7248330.1 tRNA (N(6)-L-threonylcarbamoyladenosine(37)-C(2))-methylthiotransferase MtaB [Flavobacteriales bacterium]MBK7286968.1 tRNA (N(6)-L-threonylcarbamoyladenosine(37)-C(2))-methylthiotransferase MtaB [Flavobacteriales bacterium]MBK9059473.1 tRNA (N(6)-L-threonylcar